MPKYHHETIQTTPFLRRSSRVPSLRRVKTWGILATIAIITYLLWTASNRAKVTPDLNAANDFYSKTVKGLNKEPGSKAGDEEAAKQVAARLKEAAQVAKDNANAKAPKPDPPSSVIGKGSAADGSERSVAGRKKYSTGEAQEVVQEETKEEGDITAELNSILKKSPIIVFSKSYCPHSRRAKTILAKYDINPAPFVVELDQHPLGPGLQARLADLTGRRTVPNVLINAVSIGGGDDVAELNDSGKLIEKIKEIGGKKILSIEAKAVEDDSEDRGL